MGNKISLVIPTVKEDGAPDQAICDVPLAGDVGEVSDGYHTFNELYQHRFLLFCALSQMASLRREPPYCWKCHDHWINDYCVPVWDGWFIAGIELNKQVITYHLPLEYWDLFDGIEQAMPPPHDGHTSADVIERLKEWLKA